uniref:Putative ribonuclease H-like domain-containing protein n=1 Tax=Tanacetum cinerariifolium TaxID=118510 RepID=A0A6L2JTF0_TANCI|nr:putative ribonuclease H-like domain-containing protein [Tanacetum cinerariifolium]
MGLGYGFTNKACFVCGSFSHLIRDCDFHEKRMAKQIELNKQKALTSTARKVNTARPKVNENRPRHNVYKSHSPIKRSFNKTTTSKENFAQHKVNTVWDKSVGAVEGKWETVVKALTHDFIGGLVAFGGSKVQITGKGLWCPRDSPFDLEAYLDSDYARANLDRKSIIGGCQFLSRRLISWQYKKQIIVATLTIEAEYVAAASCCRQVLWIQNQMLDYGFKFMNTKIYIDNESTICIIKNPVFHSKTKHIKIRHHFIRDAYENKLIQVLKIHSDENVSDILIKAFDVSMFKFLIEENARFHEIVDFLSRSSIFYALTVSPNVCTSFIEQFWKTATFKTINNISQINAKVVVESVVITKASIRSDLIFNDVDGIDCLTNEAIFENLALMGYEGDLTKLTFQKALFSPQWKFLIHTIIHCLSSKKHDTSQDPRVNLEGTGGSRGDQVKLPHDSPLSGGHTSDRAEGSLNLEELSPLCINFLNRILALKTLKDAQAKEILTLKARIKKLEKRCKVSISHHKAWLRSVAKFSKMKKLERATAIRNKPPTRTQLRRLMMTYLKHKGSFTHSQLIKRNFEEIRALYIKEQEKVANFVPVGSDDYERLIQKINEKAADVHKEKVLEEPDSTKVLKMKARKKAGKQTHADDESSDKGADSSKKRKAGPRMKRMFKRQKTDADLKEEEHLKTFLKIASDEEEVVDYEVLEKKFQSLIGNQNSIILTNMGQSASTTGFLDLMEALDGSRPLLR